MDWLFVCLASSFCLFGWAIRLRYDHSAALRDAPWLTIFAVWQTRHSLLHGFVDVIAVASRHAWSFLSLQILCGSILLLYLIYLFLHRRYRPKEEEACKGDRSRSPHLHSDDCTLLKPLLIPCRTSHTRLVPKTHSFSYSYLFVGVPIGWRGSIGNIVSADQGSLSPTERKSSTAWFSVRSADHLARGDSSIGLQGKLHTYLKAQNECPDDYKYAYLVTAPHFLGYSFNPVSFWYLYNEQKRLAAMILEVNNTFDERRMYLLKDANLNPQSSGTADAEPTTSVSGEDDIQQRRGPERFAGKWPKDFHVSPFNSRKGAYSLAATDPLFPDRNGTGAVENTITLSSSKGEVKLVARVFSTSAPIDPSLLGTLETWKFLFSWWWVGFVTFPRIAREAAKLFFVRKLHVWFRPEVHKDSVGRNETKDEAAIAVLFPGYLRKLMEESSGDSAVRYVSCTNEPIEVVFEPGTLADDIKRKEIVTLRPTTPLFYANLARAADPLSFLSTESHRTDPLKSILSTDSPQDLLKTIQNSRQTTTLAFSNVGYSSLAIRLRWWPINLLRRFSSKAPPRKDHCFSSLTGLDRYAISCTDTDMVDAYRRAVLIYLLSDYVAFGVPELLHTLIMIVRIWLCWIAASALVTIFTEGADTLRNTTFSMVSLGLALGAIHVWAIFGYLV